MSASNALPVWKRSLDLGCLLLALPVLAPLMLAVALLIRLSSGPPVLFRQERIGLHGIPFLCFKFRTMTVGADPASHQRHLASLINSSTPMKKLDENFDSRIIRLGNLLRASAIDELPQVFNVLRGEMSLVGPRPCILYEYEQFDHADRARFNAVPGMTGLWQVSGKNDTTFKEMIALDIAYASQLSLARDLSIIWRTFPVVFRQVNRFLKRRLARRKMNKG